MSQSCRPFRTPKMNIVDVNNIVVLQLWFGYEVDHISAFLFSGGLLKLKNDLVNLFSIRTSSK